MLGITAGAERQAFGVILADQEEWCTHWSVWQQWMQKRSSYRHFRGQASGVVVFGAVRVFEATVHLPMPMPSSAATDGKRGCTPGFTA